jgi:hypothetical protein
LAANWIQDWFQKIQGGNEKLDKIVALLDQLNQNISNLNPSVNLIQTPSGQPITMYNQSSIQDTLEALTVQRFGEFRILQLTSGSVSAGQPATITVSAETTDLEAKLEEEKFLLCRQIGFYGVVNVWTVTSSGIDYLKLNDVLLTPELLYCLYKLEPYVTVRTGSQFLVTNTDAVARTLYINLIGTELTKEEYVQYNQLVNQLYLKR